MAKATRRTWLKRMAAGSAAYALAMTRMRELLAADALAQGVARVRGDARINGVPAKRGMVVKQGDVVTTGPGGMLVTVVGRDAFLLRASTRVEFGGTVVDRGIDALRVITVALLSVFAPGERKQIRTLTASIGIRGTGVYIEAEAARTYVCTCYGEAELVPVAEPAEAEIVRTFHHDQPRYIYPKGMPRMIETAPVINHTDAELVMLESLVGRLPPFPPYPRY
jgi:hypothetical protein